LKNNKLSHNLK